MYASLYAAGQGSTEKGRSHFGGNIDEADREHRRLFLFGNEPGV